jgi:hypothetical protein
VGAVAEHHAGYFEGLAELGRFVIVTW